MNTETNIQEQYACVETYDHSLSIHLGIDESGELYPECYVAINHYSAEEGHYLGETVVL